MSVRLATYEDDQRLLDMLTAFNDEYYGVPIDPERASESISRIRATGIVLVSDHGFIAGVPFDDPFRDQTIMVELGWYSTGSDGAVLLDQFIEYTFRHFPASEIRMTTLAKSPKIAADILKRKGFVELETSHALYK